MDNTKRTTDGPRVFVYQGNVPPLLGLLLLAPLLLVFLSLAAALVAGGTVAALVLPWFFRGRFGKPPGRPTASSCRATSTRGSTASRAGCRRREGER